MDIITIETLMILYVLLILAYVYLVYCIHEIKRQVTVGDSFSVIIKKAREEHFVGNLERAKEYLLRAKFRAEGQNEKSEATKVAIELFGEDL